MKVYRSPGSGTIKFARQFIGGLTIAEALPVIKRLMKGELHDPADKRVKRCSFCGYFYRDQTRPNNSKTCSRECKIDRDTLKRQQKRADEALLNPKQKRETKIKYLYWLEYPFWLHEYDMLKNSWKYEAPYSPKKVELIAAAKRRSEMLGGKRTAKRVVPYNGDEKDPPRVFVRFTRRINNKPGEVIVSHMTPTGLSEYYSNKYPASKLRMERWRAQNLAAVKTYKGNS